jgi:hypothetical protein
MFVCCVRLYNSVIHKKHSRHNALVCMGVLETRIFEITQPGCRLEKHIPDTFGGKRHLDLQNLFS